jgi:hypothetical protein
VLEVELDERLPKPKVSFTFVPKDFFGAELDEDLELEERLELELPNDCVG